MRGRWIANGVLLVFVLVLGTLIRHELAAEHHTLRLTDLAPAHITLVERMRPDGPPLKLVREQGRWFVETPYRVAARNKRVKQLVRIASTPVVRTLPEVPDPAELGFKAKGLQLALDGLTMRFGGTDPLTHARYVAIGERVYLIEDGFYHHLVAPPEAWVDHQVLPPGFVPVSGSIDGEPLPAETLAALPELVAEAIEPLEDVLDGRLLSLVPKDEARTIRFIVSGDGLRWTRLDQRLVYLLTDAPALPEAEERADGFDW